MSGLLVNGPYALITTSVSAELGTHRSLVSSARALATVTAIIDGTGSIGQYQSLNQIIPFTLICSSDKLIICYLSHRSLVTRGGSWSTAGGLAGGGQ